MKNSWRAASKLALGAVIALVLVPALHAGPTAGKFSLPFDAQWGSLVLPTDSYTFSLADFASRGTVLVYRQGQPLGYVRAQFEPKLDQSNDFKLVCVRHDGRVIVRELRTARGTFYFEVPKEFKTFVAKQTQPDGTVSVAITGE
jgi:hypothetical protein